MDGDKDHLDEESPLLDSLEEEEDEDAGAAVEEEAGGRDDGGGTAEPFRPAFAVSHEAKLRELLRNLCTIEVKIYSEAAKEFVALLRGDSGGELLRQYVESSPRCAELLEAWKMRQGKPGMSHVFSLVAAVLDHPLGRSPASSICRNLDGFARLVIGQRLEDVCTELNSEESRRQNAALRLLTSVVRRGMGLASEVAKSFNFKLPVLTKLSGTRKKKGGKDGKKHHGRHSTRKAFVEFAMSFLEVGNPRLIRWILQQRDVYFGVLRGLGDDDEETVVFVLSTLRDRVLTVESLPPALRSVLFGSVTLEQLISVSGSSMGGPAADLAHQVLVMVCTDPRNGLMPDTNLKGNRMRLLDLMKKLKATEIKHHKDLLLAIVKQSTSLCSLYMDALPYDLEPSPSPSWFSAISLTADVISSCNSDTILNLLATSASSEPPHLDSTEMQGILKCIIPRSFARTVSNKGLLHSEILVKHGSLRLLLEILRSLNNLFNAIDGVVKRKNQAAGSSEGTLANLLDLPGFGCFHVLDKCLHSKEVDAPGCAQLTAQKWLSLEKDIQDEVRSALPDPQVLLKLLSSPSKSFGSSTSSLKRCAQAPEVARKKLKTVPNTMTEDVDILISGINSENIKEISEGIEEDKIMEETVRSNSFIDTLTEIWGELKPSEITDDLTNMDNLFHTKLLDVLAFYLRTMPTALEGSFDFFKILPSDPSNLSFHQKQSLLSLLIEHVGIPTGQKDSSRIPELMYKHLQPLANMMIHSQEATRHQAYVLARSAMLSTGAFDQNPSEIDSWFLFLPGYKDKYFLENQAELNLKLSAVIIPFLCDAVSTMGNNLYRFLDQMRVFVSKLKGLKDGSPCFSPLVICILQKCTRLLESDSSTFKVSERAMISFYVSNTLSFLLQTQACPQLLAGLVNLLLNESFVDSCSKDDKPKSSLCEWKPLKNLLVFAHDILYQHTCDSLLSVTARRKGGNSSSFYTMLNNVREIIETQHKAGLVGVAVSLSSSIVCATPDDIFGCFPLLVTVAQNFFGAHPHCLSSVLFLEWNFLDSVAKLWPDMFFSGLEMFKGTVSNNNHFNGSYFTSWKEFITNTTSEPALSQHIDSNEYLTTSFNLMLKHAPFHAMFASVLNYMSCNEFVSSNLLGLLEAKLSEEIIEDSMISLQLTLFWAYQIRSSFSAKSSDSLERLFQMCFTLIEHVVDNLLADTASVGLEGAKTYSRASYGWEIAELILVHPLISQSLSDPLPTKKITYDNLEDFLVSSNQILHPIDCHILLLMNKVADFIISLIDCQNHTLGISVSTNEAPIKAFKSIIQRSVNSFRKNFKLCVLEKAILPLLPSFCVFQALMHFLSPFELLELGHWMLCKVGNKLAGWISPKASVLSVALYVAGRSFEMLCSILPQKNFNKAYSLLWSKDGRRCADCLLQDVYLMVLDFAIHFNLEHADICLLNAVDAAYVQRVVQPAAHMLPVSMLVTRMITSTPVKILPHCLDNMNKTKARLLFELTEVSTLHLYLFGMTFLGIISNLSATNLKISCPSKQEVASDGCNSAFTDENFLLMLPAALSFFTRNLHNFKRHDPEHAGTIPSFYSRILLEGFSNWREYISEEIFLEGYDGSISRIEEFEYAISNTLLGKSILMLRYFFAARQNSVNKKQRLKIFENIYNLTSVDEELLECSAMGIKAKNYRELFDLINKVIGKISFTWLLLFPSDDLSEISPKEASEDSKLPYVRKDSKSERCAKVKFVNILVAALDKIVRNFSLKQVVCDEGNSCGWYHLLRFLEIHILRNILQLAAKIKGSLDKLTSIPFVEPLIKSSLIHRFEDPFTLRFIYYILRILDGGYSACQMLELLLGHSKFASVILKSYSSSDSSNLAYTGTFLQPVPSIFKLVGPSYTIQDASGSKDIEDGSSRLRYFESGNDKMKLELIKLLRLLHHVTIHQHGSESREVVQMNSKELIALLLCGYGASLSESDVEIFHFIHELGSSTALNSGCIGELDYLWGASAIKLRKEQTSDTTMNSIGVSDCETIQEKSKRLFRENLLIDSKRCALTALNFCYERPVSATPLYLKELQLCDIIDSYPQELIGHVNMDGTLYDPAFILRFSIHSLLKCYIEPVEFARLGLLAIAFASLSSPDDDMRKLGYEVLTCFQRSLANNRKSKDVLQLQLLLTYLQNGIMEPWQRIPSMSALFAAEASFILLDTSQDNFHSISKLLMRSPKVDLKDIPLFHSFFGSGSTHNKIERLWILRLIYAGLNIDDDGQILVRKYAIEFLLSFYTSSLSDSEMKYLILQIVRKSVKLHSLARCLVEHSGLLSWLYSVLVVYGERICEDQKNFNLEQLELILKIILDVISLRFATEWLQKSALEQLSKISSYLHSLIAGSVKLLKGNMPLVNIVFHIIYSTLRISQKRKVYQAHLFFSLDGIFQLYQAIDKELSNCGFSHTFELGLKTLLMNTPPPVTLPLDKAKLSKVVLCTVTAALQSHCRHRSMFKQPDTQLLNSLEEQKNEESLVSKLLRWITASVILGSISSSSKAERTVNGNLLSLLEYARIEMQGNTCSSEWDSSTNKALAVTILYLQHLLGADSTLLPSVISALSLLLYNDACNVPVRDLLDEDHASLIASLCSKIRCPAEANSSWRWSYYQPWKDHSFESTLEQSVEEDQACQTLLLVFSNALGGKLSDLAVLLPQDLEQLFLWQRRIIIRNA